MGSGWDYLAKLNEEDRQARRRGRYSGRDVTDSEAADYVTELVNSTDACLTTWEIDFLDRMCDEAEFTAEQRRKIDQIHHDRIRSRA
jgi:hypothetical protein